MKQKLFGIGKRILRHELLTGSFYLLVGTQLSNLLAFLFTLFVVRKLTTFEYGDYAALISLFVLATIPAQAFSPIIVRFATDYFAKKQKHKATQFFWNMSRTIAIISVLFIIGFTVFAKQLSMFLHIESPFLVIIVGFLTGATYMGIVNIAFLQSLLRFDFLAFTTSLGAILKLLFGIAVIILGFHVAGVLWAYFFSLLVPFFLTFFPLRSLITHPEKGEQIELKEIVFYALPTAIAVFSLSSFTSSDILLVKHFFSGHDAGLYAGLSLIGKIIFYFTAPISTVMFPLVIKRYNQKKAFKHVLYLSLLFILFPSIALTVCYFLFPSFVISFFLGGKGYQSVSPVLGWFGIFLCLFSVLNVFVNFFLSLKRTEVSIIVSLGAVLQIALISFFHTNIFTVVIISIIVALVVLFILLLYYIKEYENLTEIQKMFSFPHRSSI